MRLRRLHANATSFAGVGPDNDFKFRFGGEAFKAAMAYNLLWTIRGIPCLYQGISFVRDFPGGPSYAVVGLAAASAQGFTVTGVRNGTYRDAVTGAVVVVVVGNATLSFTVNPSSAGIYVLDGPGKIGVDGDFLR